MKMEQLGVPAEIIDEFGIVSSQTAEAMALGARRRTGATWSLAVTGNAGPTIDGPVGAKNAAPVGMIYVALSGPTGVVSSHRQWPTADRTRVRAFASQMALDLLLRNLNR
jgi:PncC family amidohydrolase